MTLAFDRSTFRQELEAELTGNILPFWMARVVDRAHGSFYGAMTTAASSARPVLKDSTVDGSVYKVGPWECPYHHSRACFEMLRRLAGESHEIRPL